MARNTSLRLVDSPPEANPFVPADIELEGDDNGVHMDDGVLHVENGDGSITIDFNPSMGEKAKSDKFYRNLAEEIDSSELSQISTEILEGIRTDEDSRKEEMLTRERGIKLLGLKLEDARADLSGSTGGLEGMSQVRHPILIEAVVRAQATLRGELLPAGGPIKIRNDQTTAPEVARGQDYQPQDDDEYQESGQPLENLAEALEKDLNHYLTAIAKEYVPDMDRMLFRVPFFGDGYRKVYNDPIKRRPVSESINAEDFIVSNHAVALEDCGRVTHRSKVRKSVLRRMQLLGAWRDVEIGNATSSEGPNPVEKAKAEAQGVKAEPDRPEDKDHVVYECHCELDLPDFAPKQFRGKGLSLPYVVVVEENSKQVLAVVRNWDEQDRLCTRKQFFVQFPYIRGLGYYGVGLLHLLGNITVALTALTREVIDALMFANFPGMLHAKQVGRQLTNQLRVPPGGSVAVDIGTMDDIRKAIMALPYKEPGAMAATFVQLVTDFGQRLGGTAHIPISEGKQDAPVGTTLALIEQATKTEDAVHKRLHAAQAEEFALLKERFREDPEALWRFNKKPAYQWQKDQFLRALDQFTLVPVADPNNPTSLHRIAKAVAIKTLQMNAPDLYDPMSVDKRIFRICNIDPDGLFLQSPAPPPPDPKMAAVAQKAQQNAQATQVRAQEVQSKAQQAAAALQDKQYDRASREKIEAMKLELERIRVQQETLIHAHDAEMAQVKMLHEQNMSRVELQGKAQELQMDQQKHEQTLSQQMQKAQLDHQVSQIKAHSDIQANQAKTERDTQMAEQAHEQKLSHTEDVHEQTLEQQKAKGEMMKKQAAAAAKAKPKSDK